MIKIIAGGKKNTSWWAEACLEYEKSIIEIYDFFEFPRIPVKSVMNKAVIKVNDF